MNIASIEDIQKLANLYDVAVVVATEVPPYSDTPIEEYKAVIDIVRNRVKHPKYPDTLLQVVWQKNQFSAVFREPYWLKATEGKWFAHHVEKCMALLQSEWPDTTDGATMYYSPISMKPVNSKPQWDFTNLEEVDVDGVRKDHFRFYREV